MHVSGTVGVDGSTDVVGQCKSALGVIEKALGDVGASFSDAVRVTYILPDAAAF